MTLHETHTNDLNVPRQPDGNGIELYRDRPREEWPRDESGELLMMTLPLDVAGLVAEA